MTYTRNIVGVSIMSTTMVSTATSTDSGGAVDLSLYFPVGRRSVKFVVAAHNSSTVTATLDIQECASTATASFANCLLGGSTSSAEWTITAGTTVAGITTIFEANVTVNYRYVRALWTQAASTDTGKYGGVTVMAFPLTRAS